MRNFNILLVVLHECLAKFKGNLDLAGTKSDGVKCDGFLCTGDGICKSVEWKGACIKDQQYFDIIYAVTHIYLIVGNEVDLAKSLLPIIRKVDKWGQSFDRREVLLVQNLVHRLIYLLIDLEPEATTLVRSHNRPDQPHPSSRYSNCHKRCQNWS